MTPDTIPRSGCVVLSLLILISFTTILTIILSHDTINSAYFQVSPLSIHKIIEEKFPRKFKMKVLYATDSNGKLKQIARQFGRKKRIVMNYHGDF